MGLRFRMGNVCLGSIYICGRDFFVKIMAVLLGGASFLKGTPNTDPKISGPHYGTPHLGEPLEAVLRNPRRRDGAKDGRLRV